MTTVIGIDPDAKASGAIAQFVVPGQPQGKDVTFKINNNLPPLFARVALAMFDELYVMDTPFFECREALTTDQGRAA